jgi:hypothetical protein
MSLNSESKQLALIIDHICNYLGTLVSARGEQAARLRQQIGLLRQNGVQYIKDNVFGTNLLACFVTARTLPISYDRVALVRLQIYNETPTGPIAMQVVETAIIHCLTTESILITQASFASRDDVAVLMARMKTAFDVAREQAADRLDSATYQTLTYLAGSLTNHLNATALTLPRIVTFSYQASLPTLYLAFRIYQDTTRSDELIAENKMVHPLFAPRDLKGLSA